MALRLVISDAVWAELEPVLHARKHYASNPPQLRDRMFMDKGYDCDAIRQLMENQGVEAVILGKTNRLQEIVDAKKQYK